MTKTLITGGIVAGCLAAVAAAGLASAQSAAPAPAFSLEQAVEIALAEVPGDVREVELEREAGMRVYEVEIRTAQGVSMEVEINAETGEILQIDAEDGCDDEDDHSNRG